MKGKTRMKLGGKKKKKKKTKKRGRSSRRKRHWVWHQSLGVCPAEQAASHQGVLRALAFSLSQPQVYTLGSPYIPLASLGLFFKKDGSRWLYSFKECYPAFCTIRLRQQIKYSRWRHQRMLNLDMSTAAVALCPASSKAEHVFTIHTYIQDTHTWSATQADNT